MKIIFLASYLSLLTTLSRVLCCAGRLSIIPAAELVPGDIVEVAGKRL